MKSRAIAAGLLVLPLLVGLGATVGAGDVLYPAAFVDRETAVLGAWLAAGAGVCFLAADALPGDPRSLGAVIVATVAATMLPVIIHDNEAGVGLSAATIFFLPAAALGFDHARQRATRAISALLLRFVTRVGVIGSATGLIASGFWMEAGLRGLSMDVPMILGGFLTGSLLGGGLLVILLRRDRWLTPVLVAGAAVGAVSLREYFAAQFLMLCAAAVVSLRMRTPEAAHVP